MSPRGCAPISTRQYYSTNEQVTKYYKNLRLVYEMESRVRELRRTSDTRTRTLAPAGTPKPPRTRRQRQSQLDRPQGTASSPRDGQQSAPVETECSACGNGAGGVCAHREKRKIPERGFQGFAFYN